MNKLLCVKIITDALIGLGIVVFGEMCLVSNKCSILNFAEFTFLAGIVYFLATFWAFALDISINIIIFCLNLLGKENKPVVSKMSLLDSIPAVMLEAGLLEGLLLRKIVFPQLLQMAIILLNVCVIGLYLGLSLKRFRAWATPLVLMADDVANNWIGWFLLANFGVLGVWLHCLDKLV